LSSVTKNMLFARTYRGMRLTESFKTLIKDCGSYCTGF